MEVEFDQRRKLIHEGLNNLPGIECSLPGGAFYAFPKVIGTGMNGSEFAKKCMHLLALVLIIIAHFFLFKFIVFKYIYIKY